ncbi:hypothetical protein [Sandarakinorhabdus sp.]|uniref:hypothetical protein n=1 Tax=Sandarakinorhabdus sp. TaxID=1916663 RepID=UPI00286E46F8|nr:hypothetical protein [Sandarakinorhabdus sp.]
MAGSGAAGGPFGGSRDKQRDDSIRHLNGEADAQQEIDPISAQDTLSAHDGRRLWQWQNRLMPFVFGGIALMGAFFLVASFIQLERFSDAVRYAPDTRLEKSLAQLDAPIAVLPAGEAAELVRWKTLAVLEAETVRQRYAQVNATLLLRAWTRQIGFVTGMIMALVGALFILTRLSEERTELGGETTGIKASLSTSSPGIVMAVLGTVLMVVTLTSPFNFATNDVAVYVGGAAQAADIPAPATLPGSDAEQRELFGPDAARPDAAQGADDAEPGPTAG